MLLDKVFVKISEEIYIAYEKLFGFNISMLKLDEYLWNLNNFK